MPPSPTVPPRRALPALFLATFLVPALASFPVLADDDPEVRIKDFGLYQTRAKAQVPHPNSATGALNIVSRLRFIRQTERIFAQIGRSFGWRYRLHAVPKEARITFRTLHPPITNPSTGQTLRLSWRTEVVREPGNLRYTGYTFDYAWELAEGRWAFQIIYRGRVIGEQAFTVVVPMN